MLSSFEHIWIGIYSLGAVEPRIYTVVLLLGLALVLQLILTEISQAQRIRG